ncbi:Chromobox protein 5 [Orchesella cincta]|uniref:Chromobox protein 5 n=1 Tax=Orchesella cincta TaxID=48709 RepID=A0A1D2MRV0_ORCCI|nr:Chromobox protein 5 [Orchesella cincta]
MATPNTTSPFDLGLAPEKIIGAHLDSNGDKFFLVKWKNTSRVDLLTNEEIKARCPALLIKYYESKIILNA